MKIHLTDTQSYRLAVLLIALVSQLTGCSLTIGRKGDTVPPGQVSEDRSGVTGVATDCLGNILYYCCETACILRESGKNFEDEFVAALASQISDPETLRRVQSHIEFEYVPAKLCSTALTLTFSAVSEATGKGKKVEITPGEMGGSGSGGRRGDLGAVIRHFLENEAGDPTLTFKITLPICSDGGGGASSAISSTASITPVLTSSHAGGGDPPTGGYTADLVVEQCEAQTCTPPADSETKIELNWEGLI